MARLAENDAGQEYSAFISHSSADKEKAQAIAASLEAKGLTCWIAPRNIRPGAEYADEIMRGIVESKCFVLVLSEAANLSIHVRREVERAASHGKPIYPVRIEEVPPSPKLEYFVAMHHWLDAWDGVLEDHAGRLAEAIASSEEWIGNKVVKRRRLMVSGGMLTLVAGAAVATALVFGDDIRRATLSDNDLARAELSEQGISFDIEGLARVLTTADADNLVRFDRAGIGIETIQAAFARPDAAEGFFRASKSKPAAIDWLSSALERNFDPNATLPDTYYEQQGILRTALRQGNSTAAVALLEGGASPYVYQKLNLTRFPNTMAVFPYRQIEHLQEFTEEEKAKLAAAFVQTGAAVALPPEPYEYEDERWRFPVEDIRKTNALIKTRYGVEVPVVSSICDAKPTRICQTASMRSGFDWCGFAETLPAKLVSDTDYREFQIIELTQLVNVVNDRAYVLARLPYSYFPGYGLVEISKDGGSWTVYKHMPADLAGMGTCKDGSGSSQDWCWRNVQLRTTDDPGAMKMNDYYDYQLSFCSR